MFNDFCSESSHTKVIFVFPSNYIAALVES